MECGLTSDKVQAISMEFARKFFAGHQVLAVTHTDGHNHSGNLHVHLTLNSLRKMDVPQEDFMERYIDSRAGYKHHVTRQLLGEMQQTLNAICVREHLHIVDFSVPSNEKVAEAEYWAKRRGQKALDEITTRGIQDFLNGKKDKVRKTIQNMITLLRVILESAMRDQLIEVNQASDRRLVTPSNRKTVREALPVEDVQDIIANLSKLDIMDQRYMALAIYTGMRRGEIIGLKWEDVDLAANVLHVRRNVTFPKGENQPCIGTPKTESGNRNVPIMSALLEYLTPQGAPGTYVVGDEPKPITFSIHRRMMERIRRTIDLHGASTHVFRHSFATMLNDAGASVKTIQSIIGQTDFKTTADRYCHARDNRKQEAVENVDKLLCS